MKILIVEDEYIIAQALSLDLEANGYSVCGIAATGNKAIEISKQENPDLIVMDINLAGDIDGIQTAIEITQKQNVKIIFMTGYSDEDFAQRVKKVDHIAFLSKPIEVEMILPYIENV